MASKSTKSGAYEMLVAQKDAITRITGIITPESIDGLENELGGAFTKLKSTHFAEGQRYGFLATVIPQEKYRIVISDAAWAYAAPVNPGAYAVAALAPGVSAAQREQIVAQHKEELTAYADYLGSQEAGKELLLYGVGDDALAPLKKQYINFGDATIHSMILHLREKTAIKMTTSQKFEYKAEGYGKQWDPTMSITAYFTALDKFRTSLADRGISTSVDEMTMAAGARMWESEMFTEDQMVAWENKTAAQQTWQALQDYFTEKWLERRQYSQATAKHSRFKDAALAAQETAAAEEEGEASAMMFALLQEQHRAQLDAMAAANQKAMDAMFERMNAIVTSKGAGPDKENAPPRGNGNPASENDTGTTKRKKKKCPHCGKTVFHKATECYELEANASKRWAGWKSVKETGEETK
jgi:hypothetical protein